MGNFLDQILDKYITYFKGIYVNRIKNLELALKVLIIVFGAQLIINILMINYVIQASIYKEVKIVVNKENLMENNEYIYERTTASRNSFENAGYGVLYQLTSFDYTNVENRVNWALSMVHPDNYEDIYKELKKDAKFAVENRVNQKFNIRDWKYKQMNSSTARITAEGFLTRTVGGIETIKGEPYKASVVINISNYSPFIIALDLKYDGKEKKAREKREEVINNYDRYEVKGMKDEKIK